LCDGFQSYETAKEIRTKFAAVGITGQWHEQYVVPSTAGHTFLKMSGPFRLSGIDGHLELTLYNDRLMTAEFSTAHGQEYIVAMKKEHKKVPEHACEKITVDRRTTFQYFADPDGRFRFDWTDRKLEKEWLNWEMEHF